MARVRQRPQRVAGDREIADHPDQRRRGREQRQRCQLAARARVRAARVEHQIQPVQAGERPRLGTKQSGECEQREHRRAGRRTLLGAAARLEQHGAEHEQQVRHIDIRAHAVGQDRHARQQHERRQRTGGATEPQRRQPVEDPATGGQREERQRHGDALDRMRRERREHDAERLDERMRCRRDRDFVGRSLPARELSAPGQRVERVVVGEADAADQPQHDRADGDRRQCAGALGQAHARSSHERARYPLARAPEQARERSCGRG